MTKSDSSTSSAESAGSGSDLNKRIKKKGRVWKGQSGVVYDIEGIAPTLYSKGTGKTGGNAPIILDVSGRATTTSMPIKSTPSDSEEKTTIQATLKESTQKVFPTSISFVRDFLAKRFRLRVRGRVSRTLVERFSSRYAELRGLKDLHFYSSKMLRDSLTMTEEELSRSSFNRWMNWGIGSNGRFLTANTSGFPRIGKECSLSDILEEQVDEKYFLSQRLVKALLEHKKRHEEAGHGFGMNIIAFQEASELEEAE